MTLIVAQIEENEVQILSDTQITHQALGATNPLKGQLKTVIINPILSISWSGQPYYAEQLIKRIYQRQVQNIVVSALEANRQSDDHTHFIICALHQNKPQLFVIRNRKVEQNVKSAYIGDGFAYKKYREFFQNNDKKDVFSKMVYAFEKVIDDEGSDTSTVGQFMTKVMTEAAANLPLNFLGYQCNNLYVVGKQVLVRKFENILMSRNADATDGGYSYTYLRGFHPYNPAYAIHFHVGGFGLLFYPPLDYGKKEVYEPTLILDEPDGENFAFTIRDKFGIEMQGLVISKDGFAWKHINTDGLPTPKKN